MFENWLMLNLCAVGDNICDWSIVRWGVFVFLTTVSWSDVDVYALSEWIELIFLIYDVILDESSDNPSEKPQKGDPSAEPGLSK